MNEEKSKARRKVKGALREKRGGLPWNQQHQDPRSKKTEWIASETNLICLESTNQASFCPTIELLTFRKLTVANSS